MTSISQDHHVGSPYSSCTKKLHIDVMCYSPLFFNRKPWHEWDLKSASTNVDRFISAANKSGWKLKVFISAMQSESLERWRERRVDELLHGYKNMPQGTSTLIGDIFRRHGVEVAYSVEMNIDYTIVCHASADGADILSLRRKHSRYTNAVLRVYKSFYISYDGQLVLEKPFEIFHILHYLHIPPKTLDINPLFASTDGVFVYRRGVPSPLVRDLGNPHVTARPLRRALYSRLGIIDLVIEEFPILDTASNRVIWEKTRVRPNNLLDFLLDSPKEALLHVYKLTEWPPRKPIFCSRAKFDKHLFAMRCVVFEICSHARGCTLEKLMLCF